MRCAWPPHPTHIPLDKRDKVALYLWRPPRAKKRQFITLCEGCVEFYMPLEEHKPLRAPADLVLVYEVMER